MVNKVAILVSGAGSNLQALIDAWRAGQFKQANLSLVVSNKPCAGALERAQAAAIPVVCLDSKDYSDRKKYDNLLLKVLKQYEIDIVCLAGFMRILSPMMVKAYRQRILNVHPSLLPSFGGDGMYGQRVHQAVIQSGVKYSGCTVHLVDEGTDTGPIVLQSVVPVLDHDHVNSLAEKVLIEEHRLYPRALELLSEDRLQIQGRRVIIKERA